MFSLRGSAFLKTEEDRGNVRAAFDGEPFGTTFDLHEVVVVEESNESACREIKRAFIGRGGPADWCLSVSCSRECVRGVHRGSHRLRIVNTW